MAKNRLEKPSVAAATDNEGHEEGRSEGAFGAMKGVGISKMI